MELLSKKISNEDCVLETKQNFNAQDYRECGFYEPLRFTFGIRYGKDITREIGTCTFSHMPNCPAVIISSDLWINIAYRGKGYAKMFQQLRYDFAKSLGAKKIIATIDLANAPQLASIIKFGWKLGQPFKNEANGNQLCLIEKEIT